MLDLSRLDLEEIAAALSDQTNYEHHWLINPQTGEIVFWTAEGGIDGQTPVDLDDLDLVGIGPLPSYIWYQDMADFAEGISDDHARRRPVALSRAKAPFAGSRTNYTRNTETCSRCGTPSATPEPYVAPSNGSPTTPSSAKRPPRNS
jgi:hypothetical protein